jgi:gentisate 1,2-dioxygenase
MTISSGSHIPYPDFKKRYEPAEPRPVHWSWRETADRLGTVEHPERGTLALTLPDGRAEIMRDVAVAYQVVPAGYSTTPHAHTWYHLFIVRSGSGTVTFHDGGESSRLSAGDIVLVPAWSMHHFTNPGSDDLVLLNVMNIPLLADLGNIATMQPQEAGA